MSSEERNFAKEDKNFFVVNPDLRDLNYGKFFKEGKKTKNFENYSSNQKLLGLNNTIKLLKKSEFVKNSI